MGCDQSHYLEMEHAGKEGWMEAGVGMQAAPSRPSSYLPRKDRRLSASPPGTLV